MIEFEDGFYHCEVDDENYHVDCGHAYLNEPYRPIPYKETNEYKITQLQESYPTK